METALEDQNRLFPVFLKLEQLRTLLVGGGKVGLEKLSALLANSPGATVTIVAREVSQDVRQLAAAFPGVTLCERAFEESDLTGHQLVIVATSDRETSRRIKEAAHARNLLTNVADTPGLCDFYLSSVVRKGNLKLAVSTNGKSPTVAKRVREFLEAVIPEDINESLDHLEKIRDNLKTDFAGKVRRLNEITSVLAGAGDHFSAGKKRKAKIIPLLGIFAVLFLLAVLYAYFRRP